MDTLLGRAEGTKIRILRSGTYVRERLGSSQRSVRYAPDILWVFVLTPPNLTPPLRRNKAPLDRRSLSQHPYLVHCAVPKRLLVLFRSPLYTQKTSLTRSEVHTPVMSGLSRSVAKVSDLYSIDTRFQARGCISPRIQGVTSHKTASCCILYTLS